jgi:hypothetical protein
MSRGVPCMAAILLLGVVTYWSLARAEKNDG